MHVEREIEAGVGLTLQEARRKSRDVRGMMWLADFFQDCQYGLRGLRRSLAFATIAILSLALGIGANTAIFTLLDHISFRMLPVREPQRLVEIGPCCLSYPQFQDLKNNLRSLEGLFAHAPLGMLDIQINGRPETARIDLASGSYYSVLGVPAAIGRAFGEEVDVAAGASPVAVISYGYWQRRFASNPGVIGKTFQRLNTQFTIIGVMPPEFFGSTVGQEFDITVPLTMDAQTRGGDSWLSEPEAWWVGLIGRLKRGTTFEQARADVHRVLSTAKFSPHGHPEEEWVLRSGGRGFDDLRQEIGKPLNILMGIVALVLLLACANIANLLLTKSSARQHEIAVRLAIGAARNRIIRQLLTEGLLLAVAGGIIGVLLANLLADALVTLISNYGPRVPLSVVPDGRVLLFAAAACIAACLLFSVTPALLTTSQSFQASLSEIRAGRWRLGKSLIVAQIAIAVLLMIAAGLFGRTMVNLYATNPGFNQNGVVLFSTNAIGLQYSPQRLHELQRYLAAELRALPGTEAAVASIPPVNRGSWGHGFIVEGTVGKEPEASLVNGVGPDFFKTLRSPVISGREFTERDTAASPRVTIVNDAFAKYYFPNRSPLGHWLAIQNHPEQRYEIVGVVQGYKYESLRRATSWRARTVFVPAAQVIPKEGVEANSYFVRTGASITMTAQQVEAALKRFDTALRPVDLTTLENHVARSVLQERMLTTIALFFAIAAVLLAAIGIYGVMAFQVSRRRREIGIRMALGADIGKVVRMILSQVARLTLLGCIIGAAAGFALTRVAETMLYDIRPTDPATFVAAVVLVVIVGLAAGYLPGKTAARTNPVETLKVE